MPALELLRPDHASSVLVFELANRAYFARSITDRGDDYFEHFSAHHEAMLADQTAGVGAYYLLVDDDGSVLGRFNLRFSGAHTADLGYRMAETATGKGLATATVRDLLRIAAEQHGLLTLGAAVSLPNVASHRILLKLGFVPIGPSDPGHLGGRAGTRYELHLAPADSASVDRSRSFGGVAAAYERFRPDYPPAVVDVVLDFAGQPILSALEIGAGTGKATRLFAERGIAVTATEPDAQMLAELRRRVPDTVATIQAPFEELGAGTTYDLVYAAASLHWTEAVGRWERVASFLEPGGIFASFGNPVELADPEVAEAVEVAQAPFLARAEIVPPGLPTAGGVLQWPGDELRGSEWFTDVQEVVVDRRFAMAAKDYIALLSTVSAYVVLPGSAREQIWERLRKVLPDEVDVRADLIVHLARRIPQL